MDQKDLHLIEDITFCLLSEYKLNNGQVVKGQPLSSLRMMLQQGYTNGRIWKSLGSDFDGFLTRNGFKIAEGAGTKPRQRGSREVVYKA